MINVSSGFKEQLNNGNRNYLSSVDIELKDEESTVLHLDSSKLWTNGISIEEAVSNDSTFDIGSTIINKATLSIVNIYDDYSDYDFSGAKVTIKVGLKLSDDTVEMVNKGIFYVDEAKYTSGIITLECLDSMSKFDRDYDSNLQFPATLQQIVQDACTKCDVLYSAAGFDGGDYVVQKKPDTSSLTYRQMLSYVGQIACQQFSIDHNDRLISRWYDIAKMNLLLNNSSSLDESEYHQISSLSTAKIDMDDVVITGVRVIEYSEDSENPGETFVSGTEGYVIEIKDNRLVPVGSGNTIASLVGEKIIGARFRPLEISFQSDPTIEPVDVVKVIDYKGNNYYSFVTNTRFAVRNLQTLKCSAQSASRNSAKRYSSATQAYTNNRYLIQQERAEREQAIEALNNALSNSSGMYITEEEQPDGSVITYLHDKPTLEDSQNIIKITAEAIGISNDGGETYPYGLFLTGDLIARLLYVAGINADYINSGAITIKDKDGDITFYADTATGTVQIKANSLTIGGKTVEQIVSDEMGDYQPINLILSNEYQGIATDANGDYDILPSVQTTAQAYYGQQNITDSCTFTTTASSGVTGSWNNSTHTYTVTELTTDDGWVDITATYLNVLTTTKRFTMSKIKGGENSRSYYVQCDAQIIKVVTDDTLDPNCINLSAYYREGLASQPYAGRFKIEELQGDSWVTVYQSAADESTVKRYLYGAIRDAAGNVITNAAGNAIAVLRDIDEIRVTFYAAGGFDTVITALSIPVVDTVASLSQKDTFNLLTNNGSAKGIYMVGNELYINATYLVTGILSDLLGKNFWNLDTGEFSLSPTTTVGGETVQEIADSAAGSAVDAMSQADVFNKLTNNGALPGIFMQNGQLYVNANYIGAGTLLADYIKGGTLTLGGSNNTNGILQILNASGHQIGKWDKDGINASNADISGKVSASEGQIGNWQISGGNLTNGLPYTGEQNSNATGMGDYGGGWAFWAGNGKFSVEQSGKLRASDAEISGTVNASNGVFNGTVNADSGVFDNITVQNSSVHSSYMAGTAGTISGGTYSGPHISGGTLGSPGGTYVGTCSGSTLSRCTLGGTALATGNGNANFYASSYGSATVYGPSSVFLSSGGTVYLAGSNVSVPDPSATLTVLGDLSVRGEKNRVITTKNFGDRKLSACETPLPTFEDYGMGIIAEDGKCYIQIDPIFSETVDPDYLPTVFLTKYGSGDIYIDNENTTHDIIVVRGTPGLKFSWSAKYRQGSLNVFRLSESEIGKPEIVDYDFVNESNLDYEQNLLDYETFAENYVNVCNAQSEAYAMTGYTYFTQYELQSQNYAALGAKYYEEFERSIVA